MSQERPEIPKVSSFFSSKETEISISDVPLSPAKNMSQEEPREISHASSILPSKETELRLFGGTISLAKKRERTSISQALQEYRSLDSEETEMPIPDVTISPAKKVRTNMSQEPRVPSKKTELRLFGVSIPLSSASSTNSDDDLKKTNYLQDPKKVFVSTTLCIHDDTWPCGNPEYPNVTCVPRNKESTEQTRKNKEMEEDKAQHETGPWIIQKELNTTDICLQLYLTIADVECHILSYLSEDDQKKLAQNDGITVNVYDHESETTHEVLLMTNYRLKDSWRQEFVHRRDLRAGDKIGFSWDRFRYELHFRVLSRANVKASAEEKKRAGVSKECTLYTWTIEKTLTQSDINCSTRLLLEKGDAESHIMRYLSTDVRNAIHEGIGVDVKAYDHDTDTEHDMVFKRYHYKSKQKYYAFMEGWAKEFVRRRKLKQGDKIGFFWSNVDSRLHFCVLLKNPY